MPISGSNNCTPLPLLSSVLMSSASRCPLFGKSCHANSETLPKVESRPVARCCTITVADAGGVSTSAGGAVGTPAAGAFSGAYFRTIKHDPSGLNANISTASKLCGVPLDSSINPILRRTGFFSLRSFSCSLSETSIAYTTHRESEENAGWAPNATVFASPPAALRMRNSPVRSERLIPYAIHFPSGEMVAPPRDSNLPYSAAVGGLSCAGRSSENTARRKKTNQFRVETSRGFGGILAFSQGLSTKLCKRLRVS